MLPPRNEAGSQAPNAPGRSAEEALPPPTITTYYLDPKIKLAPFVKAVRTAKIFRFQPSDVETAHEKLGEADPTLARTLALARGNRTPEAIERWVAEATEATVRASVPSALDYVGAKSVLECIVNALGSDLAEKAGARRTRAQNLLHLALIWLIEQRALDPLDALRVISKLFRRSSARRNATRILAHASPTQLRDLSLIAGLADEAVVRATQERSDAVAKQARLQEQVATLDASLRALRDREQQLISQVERLRSDLEQARREFDEQRQLRQLDRASQQGRMRQFLLERLGLLLSDARDALEFDPPHVDAARQRIESARETIDQQIGTLDG
jgi:hypothetical protein